MTPEQMVLKEIRSRGMTIKDVSIKAGICYQRLTFCLKGRSRRGFRPDEYLRLCVLLELDPRGYQQPAGDVGGGGETHGFA